LWKYKVQNLIGIFGLAVGCLLFALCSHVVQLSMSIDTQYPGHERMYRLSGTDCNVIGDAYSTLDKLTGIEKRTRVLSSVGGYATLTFNGEDKQIPFGLTGADTAHLDFYSLKLVAGHRQTMFTTPNSVVLFEKEARKYGEPAELIGAKVVMDSVAYTVTGVVQKPKGPSRYLYGHGLLFNNLNNTNTGTVRWTPWYVFIMLEKGVTADGFQKQLDNYPFTFDDYNHNGKCRMTMQQINQRKTADNLGSICIFAVGLLVLLVALFNYISFQTAQFYNRLKECAVRKVNGAGRIQQFLLFYSEIAIVFVVSYAVGVLLLELVMPLIGYVTYLGDGAMTALRIQLAVSVLVGMGLAVVLCIIPTHIIGRLSVRVILFGMSERGSKGRMRKILLFLQLAILLAFLSVTLVLKGQTGEVRKNFFHIMPAKEQQRIIEFEYQTKSLSGNVDIILQNLRQMPDVEAVSLFSYFSIVSHGSQQTMDLGMEGYEKVALRRYDVDTNFCSFFHIKLLHGKCFDETSAPDVVVVDETFAALYPDHNPVGQSFDKYTIVGVVETVQTVKEDNSEFGAKRPVFYIRSKKENPYYSLIYIKTAEGKTQEVAKQAKECIREFIPEPMYIYMVTLNFDVDQIFIDEEEIAKQTSIFFVICMVLSLLSIYSAVAMSAEKRRKEMAIRKINGATVWNIILLFSRSYIFLWTAACVLLFPAVYIVGNLWIRNFNQQFSMGILFFLTIYLSILALILLTIVLRVLKVARENPAEVVKKE
jgi:ABC-type antimicrobial peptide transport system permease subunit